MCCCSRIEVSCCSCIEMLRCWGIEVLKHSLRTETPSHHSHTEPWYYYSGTEPFQHYPRTEVPQHYPRTAQRHRHTAERDIPAHHTPHHHQQSTHTHTHHNHCTHRTRPVADCTHTRPAPADHTRPVTGRSLLEADHNPLETDHIHPATDCNPPAPAGGTHNHNHDRESHTHHTHLATAHRNHCNHCNHHMHHNHCSHNSVDFSDRHHNWMIAPFLGSCAGTCSASQNDTLRAATAHTPHDSRKTTANPLIMTCNHQPHESTPDASFAPTYNPIPQLIRHTTTRRDASWNTNSLHRDGSSPLSQNEPVANADAKENDCHDHAKVLGDFGQETAIASREQRNGEETTAAYPVPRPCARDHPDGQRNSDHAPMHEKQTLYPPCVMQHHL